MLNLLKSIFKTKKSPIATTINTSTTKSKSAILIITFNQGFNEKTLIAMIATKYQVPVFTEYDKKANRLIGKFVILDVGISPQNFGQMIILENFAKFLDALTMNKIGFAIDVPGLPDEEFNKLITFIRNAQVVK